MLSQNQIKNLEYFLGKVVTFITPPINRPLQDKDILNYILGKITKIDEAGIWYEHLQSKKLNFIFYNNLISIAEEEFVIENIQAESKIAKPPLLEQIRKAIAS